MEPDTDAFLEHYGKKGMKWGVTKAEAKTAVRTSRNKATGNLQDRYTKTRKDGTTGVRKTKTAATVADIMFTGGMYTSVQINRSAGFSRGSSAAIALIGGPPGSVLLSAVKVRQDAKRSVLND